jgi:hypothetical protein
VFEGNPMEEMTGAVQLGLFAGEAAIALERTINQGEVGAGERQTLAQGLWLLEALQGPRNHGGEGNGPQHLAIGEAGLDILTAIEAQAEDTTLGDFLTDLAEGLRNALDGDVGGNQQQLESLLQLFVAIGDAEVERVSCLAQPRSPSIPLWSPLATTSRF